MRPLYRHGELARLLEPRSIAIVGASPRAGSFGARTLANLATFEGRVHLVNARYQEIDGRPCHPSIAALPEVPDCVVIVVGQEAVEPIVDECVASGVGGIIVYASGYAETGRADRVALQRALVARVRGTRTRLLGPNCMGFANYAIKARLTFGRMPEPRALGPHSVGIVTQSGALSMALAQAVEHGVSVSHSMTAGNAADVGIEDMVSYLVDDPDCRAIVCLFEGLDAPLRFMQAAALAWAAEKPLVVYKMATGEQGAAAALSHTGSLAGSAAAYRAAFERAGVILVDDLEDVMETAVFFAKAGRPKGRGAIAIVTSGGAGVIAADKADETGVPMPQPEGDTLAILKANIPEFGSARNPCDITAQAMAGEGPLRICADALLADPAYSTAVVPHPYADDYGTKRLELWKALADKHDKIVCTLWSTEWLEGPGSLDIEAHPRLALFRSTRRCFAAIAAWHAREQLRRAEPAPSAPLIDAARRAEAAQRLRAHAGDTLTEREAKAVLALYGIPVVPEHCALSAEEAVRAAAKVGYPVVLKLESPDVPHKTEAGVVRLNLDSPDAVRAAYVRILERARAIQPPARIAGVLVQPMIRGEVELVIGARIDPQFGALVLAGMGGVMVELLRDTAVGLAPLAEREARRMWERLKGYPLLQGFRGSAPVDIDRLADILCRVAAFAADHADCIREIDVNPLICAGERIIAVDALILVGEAQTKGTTQ